MRGSKGESSRVRLWIPLRLSNSKLTRTTAETGSSDIHWSMVRQEPDQCRALDWNHLAHPTVQVSLEKSRTKTLGHGAVEGGCIGTPWQPKIDSRMVPGQGSEPLGLERRERSVYITLERQLKHGPTAPDATVMTRILNRARRSAGKGSPSCIQRPVLRRLERKVKWLWMRAEPLNNQALQGL